MHYEPILPDSENTALQEITSRMLTLICQSLGIPLSVLAEKYAGKPVILIVEPKELPEPEAGIEEDDGA